MRHPIKALCVAAILASVGALASGCGPILSTGYIIDAEAKLAAAEAAEAPTYAPYEYTAAEAYLQKAHEELGYADYGPALDFAYKAGELAEKGTARANDEKDKRIDNFGPPGAPGTPTTSSTTSTTTTTTTTTAPATTSSPVIIKKLPTATTEQPQ